MNGFVWNQGGYLPLSDAEWMRDGIPHTGSAIHDEKGVPVLTVYFNDGTTRRWTVTDASGKPIRGMIPEASQRAVFLLVPMRETGFAAFRIAVYPQLRTTRLADGRWQGKN